MIDLLAVDARGEFVLLELERDGEEELLRRLHEHQAWVASQGPFLRRLYGAGPLSLFRPPRVMALSDAFSSQFLESIRNLDFPSTLFHYRILISAGRPMLYLEPAGSEEPGALPAGTSEQEIYPTEMERLTPEELEEFYGFEQRRLAQEKVEERVEQ